MVAVIVFVIFRDDISGEDSWITAWLFSRGRSLGTADRIAFDEDRDALHALFGENLAVLSGDRLAVYDASGTERLSRKVNFSSPALAVAGDRVIAYDRSGSSALVADTRSVRVEYDFPVLTAAGGSRGHYALVTRQSGYRSVAQVYDDRDRLYFKWYSAESYILAAALSPSGRRLAVAAVGQKGETALTTITFLDTERTEPLAVAEIEGEPPLAAEFSDNSHVYIVTESGVYFYTDEGLLLGHYSYGGLVLRSVPKPSLNALFLHLGRESGRQYGRLVCLSYDGVELGQAAFTEESSGISAGGRYGASLEGGVLTRYTVEDGVLKPEILGEADARGLILDSNGRILLLYSGYGKWYNADNMTDNSEQWTDNSE